jgi:uncharacterized membrane protein YiaA
MDDQESKRDGSVTAGWKAIYLLAALAGIALACVGLFRHNFWAVVMGICLVGVVVVGYRGKK